jgi:branched-chain amino acid transport system substrate-binding protein
MNFPGIGALIEKYQMRAQAEGVDTLGYYMAPWGYAQLQVMGQAIEATKGLDDKKLADFIRANSFKTVLGDIKFGKGGEWAQSRVLQVQFHNIKGNDIEQFRTMGTQTLLTPPEYNSGSVIYPYEKAK